MMENKLTIEKYKNSKREVLTSTVLLLITDMKPEERQRILFDQTPEELVDYCKSIYDSEFDMNVESLGIAGANEIAWQEALGIFNEVEED